MEPWWTTWETAAQNSALGSKGQWLARHITSSGAQWKHLCAHRVGLKDWLILKDLKQELKLSHFSVGLQSQGSSPCFSVDYLSSGSTLFSAKGQAGLPHQHLPKASWAALCCAVLAAFHIMAQPKPSVFLLWCFRLDDGNAGTEGVPINSSSPHNTCTLLHQWF